MIVLGALRCKQRHAREIVGRASVVDEDTIEIHGERVRAYGIEPPETPQTCTVADEPYRRAKG